MRKPDEIELFARMRAAEARGERCAGRAIGRRLGMHEGRQGRIMEKWADRGWLEYGVSAFAGWLTPAAPLSIGAYPADDVYEMADA